MIHEDKPIESNTESKQPYEIDELYNFADGNDDILGDMPPQDAIDTRRGMWAQSPYSVDDGTGVINISEDYPRPRADKVASEIGKKINVNPHYIGSGFFGVAYDIGDNKVLKITSDDSEAADNLSLIGKELKYIAEPYKVFQVSSTSNNFPQTFVIILEKLRTDAAYFKRMFKRLEYVFSSMFKSSLMHTIYSYLNRQSGDDYSSKVDAYLSKNPDDAKFFYNILEIAKELAKHGIESYDYYNPENLGYKKSGDIGFFDIGFGESTVRQGDAENISVDEDGSAKFATGDGIGRDGFPAYAQGADSSPMIRNNLSANSSMYDKNPMYDDHELAEDLENNYVVGDATDDEYMLSEVVNGGEYQAYHGSNTKIDRFTDDFVGAEEATDQEGPGIYFTTNPEDARSYGNNISSVILRPRKLVDESSHQNVNTNKLVQLIKLAPDWKMHAQNWDENPNVGIRAAVDSMMQYSENEKDLFQQVWYDFFRHNPIIYVRGMVKLGYDGQIINKAEGNKHIIVYNPDIIELTNTEVLQEERKKSYMSGSKTVTVKKKCQLGGNGDGTSTACNQGDDNNLEFGSVSEEIELDSGFVDGWNRYGINNDGVEVGEIEVSTRDRYMILNKIFINPEHRQNGYADAVMKILFDYANQNSKIIALTPDNMWGASKEKLKKWYKSLGFTMNSGKHKDFQTREVMVKKPEFNEGVGDKYSEKKFGIPDEFTDFDSKYREKKSGEENVIVYTNNDDITIIKNPTNLNNIGANVRGVIDKEGNFYVEQESNVIHVSIVTLLIKLGILKLDYYTSLSEDLPTEYVTVQRYYTTQDITIGESNIMMHPDDDRDSGFGDYVSHEEAAPVFQKFIDAAKRKNPRINFINVLRQQYANNLMTNKKKYDESNVVGNLESSKNVSNLASMNETEIMSLQDLPFKEEMEQLGGKMFSVGGAVRDEFLGKESKDLDILITGIPMDELEQMLSRYGRVDAVGKSFGVLKFKPSGSDEDIDVAIPRTETPTGEGGHQGFDVTSDHELPLETDLERRDFTINAMAKDIDENVIDPY